MDCTVHLAHFYRYLWEETKLIIVSGDGAKLAAGHEAYEAHYGISSVQEDQSAILHRLFSAAGLAAVSLADRESWGWSIALPHSTIGMFCAVEPEGMICGSILESDRQKVAGV